MSSFKRRKKGDSEQRTRLQPTRNSDKKLQFDVTGFVKWLYNTVHCILGAAQASQVMETFGNILPIVYAQYKAETKSAPNCNPLQVYATLQGHVTPQAQTVAILNLFTRHWRDLGLYRSKLAKIAAMTDTSFETWFEQTFKLDLSTLTSDKLYAKCLYQITAMSEMTLYVYPPLHVQSDNEFSSIKTANFQNHCPPVQTAHYGDTSTGQKLKGGGTGNPTDSSYPAVHPCKLTGTLATPGLINNVADLQPELAKLKLGSGDITLLHIRPGSPGHKAFEVQAMLHCAVPSYMAAHLAATQTKWVPEQTIGQTTISGGLVTTTATGVGVPVQFMASVSAVPISNDQYELYEVELDPRQFESSPNTKRSRKPSKRIEFLGNANYANHAENKTCTMSLVAGKLTHEQYVKLLEFFTAHLQHLAEVSEMARAQEFCNPKQLHYLQEYVNLIKVSHATLQTFMRCNWCYLSMMLAVPNNKLDHCTVSWSYGPDAVQLFKSPIGKQISSAFDNDAALIKYFTHRKIPTLVVHLIRMQQLEPENVNRFMIAKDAVLRDLRLCIMHNFCKQYVHVLCTHWARYNPNAWFYLHTVQSYQQDKSAQDPLYENVLRALERGDTIRKAEALKAFYTALLTRDLQLYVPSCNEKQSLCNATASAEVIDLTGEDTPARGENSDRENEDFDRIYDSTDPDSSSSVPGTPDGTPEDEIYMDVD